MKTKIIMFGLLVVLLTAGCIKKGYEPDETTTTLHDWAKDAEECPKSCYEDFQVDEEDTYVFECVYITGDLNSSWFENHTCYRWNIITPVFMYDQGCHCDISDLFYIFDGELRSCPSTLIEREIIDGRYIEKFCKLRSIIPITTTTTSTTTIPSGFIPEVHGTIAYFLCSEGCKTLQPKPEKICFDPLPISPQGQGILDCIADGFNHSNCNFFCIWEINSTENCITHLYVTQIGDGSPYDLCMMDCLNTSDVDEVLEKRKIK